jgi:F420-dependent methylenetetrahydromethanopterin dehydrogenase
MNLIILKSVAKSVANTALSATSELLDKGAELADNAKDYLDTNDTSKREKRKEKHTSIFGYGKDKS